MRKILIVLTLLLLSTAVFAHQPRITYDSYSSEINPFIITNPEISQAFYGNLKITPDFYLIESNKEFILYLQILSPDLNDSRTDFSVGIYRDNELLYTLYGKNFTWIKFYEEYAGDNYLAGPMIETQAHPGSYKIKIYNSYNSDNFGKYVLVVGKEESFPLNEVLNALFVLPKLKSDFFNVSPLTFFSSIIGRYFLISIVTIIVAILLVYIIIKIIKRQKKRRKTSVSGTALKN
ncbi:MAG: hypothetical protein PHU12_04405 [Candidatus Aenigmarchaeota archaeon]|nr:hypothetical protein [Candidatus Aenigmarchaeota archaeon]